MQKIILLDSFHLELTTNRLCQELIENYDSFENTALIGLQPRGRFFAQRLHKNLEAFCQKKIELGYLDTTFHRDDFRRRDYPLVANSTNLPFQIEDKQVILVDDVLFTGRTIRAALSAMSEFGRPSRIELLVLVDRRYSRDLPIQPDYVGKTVNSIQEQRIIVEWQEQGFEEDKIWLASPIK